MADSIRSAETGRIGAHASILEACAELGCAPLEGDAVFESPRGHHFSVLQRDDLDSVESTRGHLTEVGKDARNHPGVVGAFARLHVIGRSIHHTLVFGVLDRLVSLYILINYQMQREREVYTQVQKERSRHHVINLTYKKR